jgi:hypothetical protein
MRQSASVECFAGRAVYQSVDRIDHRRSASGGFRVVYHYWVLLPGSARRSTALAGYAARAAWGAVFDLARCAVRADLDCRHRRSPAVSAVAQARPADLCRRGMGGRRHHFCVLAFVHEVAVGDCWERLLPHSTSTSLDLPCFAIHFARRRLSTNTGVALLRQVDVACMSWLDFPGCNDGAMQGFSAVFKGCCCFRLEPDS